MIYIIENMLMRISCSALKEVISKSLCFRGVFHGRHPIEMEGKLRQGNLHTTVSSSQKGSTSGEKFCVVASPHNLEPVVGVTCPEFFFQNLHKWENAPAFECGVSGRKYTHLEVYKQSKSFGAALKQHGLGDEDVVAILLPNIPEYAAIVLGILDAGITASPFNPTYTAHEIGTQINTCGAKSIVTLPQFLPQVKEAKGVSPCLKSIILVGEAQEGCHSFFEMVKVNPKGVQFLRGKDIDTQNRTALLPWSSGTTGPPKGVMLTHSSINTNLLQLTSHGMLMTRPFEGGQEQFRFLGMLPFFHIYGFVLIMANTLYQGASTLTLPKFEPATFMSSMRRHRPTYIHLVPPLIAFLANSHECTPEDLSSILGMMGGAAPIGPCTINRVLEKAGKKFLFQEGYGMTEMSPVSHLTPEAADNQKIGSCGVPVPGTICKVVDPETGEALGPNQPGELCVKGPQLMKGYYNNENATRETIDLEGWLHTGDIFQYDQDNYFYVVDRLKELIKVRGLQVAPSELEELLRTHPDVADVAVIGVPDERAGELPRAYLVSKSDNPSEESIHKFIEAKVSVHKKLKGGVEFVKIIPKAASGKILRRELKADYLSKHPPAKK